jgi:REP element-mobilizing transposase RayT
MMKYNPAKHHRRSIRLKGYDYTSPGAYFVTICVQDRECVLGEVMDGEMRLNTYGCTVDEFWRQVSVHFTNVSVDAHVTMPNHIHAVITIHDTCRGAVPVPDEVSAPIPTNGETLHQGGETLHQGGETLHQGGETPPLPPPLRSTIARPTLGQIVAYYKYQTTKIVNQMLDASGTRFWQRNYWEHIIRSQTAYRRIYRYIQDNPARWKEDQLHPNAPLNPFN